jgi:hypothetical protein
MATQAILPPPQDADSCSKLADLGKAANPNVTVCSKVTERPYVTSHVTICRFGQSRNFSANSSTSGFSKKPFSQNRCGSYLPYCSVKSARLFPKSWEIKYASYKVKSPLCKLWGRGSRRHFSPEATSPRRVMIKQGQTRPLQHTVDSKLFVVFPPKILLHTVRIF